MRMHRLFVRAATSFGIVFGWIAIFIGFFGVDGSLGPALAHTAFVYILGQVVIFFITPLAAKLLRHGTDRLMLYGTLTGAAAFALLALSLTGEPFTGFTLTLGAFAFSILLGVGRSLYRVPYTVGIVHAFGRARPVSRFSTEIAISVLPALAGFALLLDGGASAVFLAAAGCMLLASLPALNVKPEYASFEWSWSETYRKLFAPENREFVTRSLAHGIESSTLHLLWPIAAALIVGLRLDVLGAVLSLTLFVVFLASEAAMRGWRILSVESSAPVRATAVFSAWIFRLTAGGPFAIIGIDAFQRLAPGGQAEGGDPLLSRDDASYVDEHSVLKEVADSVGKILPVTCVLLLIPVSTVAISLAVPILLAALAATLVALGGTSRLSGPRVGGL